MTTHLALALFYVTLLLLGRYAAEGLAARTPEGERQYKNEYMLQTKKAGNMYSTAVVLSSYRAAIGTLSASKLEIAMSGVYLGGQHFSHH